jgi:methylated-DNA-[protein]-cysteine S-methyltransferase
MIEKQPEQLLLDRLPTPIGEALLVTDESGHLRALDWENYEDRLRRLLRLHYRKGPGLSAGRAPDSMRRALDAYFAGELAAIDGIACRTAGTPFQRSVWAALRQIPVGETVSYGTLAARLDKPRAVRAVGLANGANPVSVVVPCHRVIGADGWLTGYGGGLDRKRWLLRHEGACFTDRAAA